MAGKKYKDMRIFGIVIRSIILVCAALCLVWACFLSSYSAGSALGFLLFGTIIAISVFWKPLCGLVKRLWSRVVGRAAVIFIGTGILVFVGVCAFFSVNMAVYISEPVEDVRAVMVLGCRVRGEEPSNMLKARLNAGLKVLEENPGAVCVVSGGQGEGEDISEAEAMQRYLMQNGISAERIFTEDKSISTRENFRFSKHIFEELGISDGIVVATNDFHQYRAEIYARQNGLEVGHISAKTHIKSFLNYWIREWLALLSAFLAK